MQGIYIIRKRGYYLKVLIKCLKPALLPYYEHRTTRVRFFTDECGKDFYVIDSVPKQYKPKIKKK